jgi:hypothetical protein
MEPTLIPLAPGGWLAITAAEALAPIGVFGRTRNEAGLHLADAVLAREALRATAYPKD